MKFWLLDDGPLGLLARHFDASWAWPASTLHLVQEVAMGCTQDRSGRRQQLLDMKKDGAPCVQVHEIPATSTAAIMLLTHLRPLAASATKDQGEHASIAFAATVEPSAIFVTMDKGAAYLALWELGSSRVATPFDLWAWLRDEHMITEQKFRDLVQSTVRPVGYLPGLPWRATGGRAGPAWSR